jgi:hypothetical protein
LLKPHSKFLGEENAMRRIFYGIPQVSFDVLRSELPL